VPGELGDMYGVARMREALRHIAHFQGRPAQAMDEQKTEASSRQTNALIHLKTFAWS